MVEGLIESGEIKAGKPRNRQKLARQVVRPRFRTRIRLLGHLLGEHAVVYGRPAIALPIPLAVDAAVRTEPKSSGDGINVVIPRWGLEQKVTATTPGVAGIMANLIEKMGLEQEHMTIEVFPHVPRAMGLGGSPHWP